MSDPAAGGSKNAPLPAWMATFADMMALMMTFFVLLFATSSVEKHKFEQIAGSLAEAFGGIQFIKSNSKDAVKGMEAGIVSKEGSTPIKFDEQSARVLQQQVQQAQTQALMDELAAELAPELQSQSVVLERDGDDVVIRFPEHVSFASGSATLVAGAAPLVERIVELVKPQQMVVVAGHTDDRPLVGGAYHSNWELSAARAASVADSILKFGRIDPKLMTVAGYADTRPIAPNDSAANRAKNRRVEIILKSPEPYPGEDQTTTISVE